MSEGSAHAAACPQDLHGDTLESSVSPVQDLLQPDQSVFSPVSNIKTATRSGKDAPERAMRARKFSTTTPGFSLKKPQLRNGDGMVNLARNVL